jgi:hypothetical protein
VFTVVHGNYTSCLLARILSTVFTLSLYEQYEQYELRQLSSGKKHVFTVSAALGNGL